MSICRFDSETLENLRQADEMIKCQKLHKTKFLRQFGLQTSAWNEWLSGKKSSTRESNRRKLDAVFIEFGL